MTWRLAPSRKFLIAGAACAASAEFALLTIDTTWPWPTIVLGLAGLICCWLAVRHGDDEDRQRARAGSQEDR